jgi:hypothetical protein
MGSKGEYSQRADDFRLAPMNGHHQAQTPRPESATTGLMRREVGATVRDPEEVCKLAVEQLGRPN